MKKLISLFLAAIMLVSVFGGMSVSAYAEQPTNGWYDQTSDGETYHLYFKNGTAVKGWQKIDGKTYYFDEEFGYLCADGFFFDDIYMYYADANGLIVKNKWEKFQWKDEDGVQTEWYYMGKDGKAVSGWQKIGGVWYYFSPELFVMYSNMPAEINGKWYYFKANGAMATGWQKIDGYWFYFTSSGAIAKGWTKVSGKWYYFATKSDGDVESIAIGWNKISGKWYYFNSSGAMTTGWLKNGGKWYYFSGSGDMKTGWQKISGKWYYFNSSGAMQKGWQKLSGSWYYFNSSGAMVTGNQKIDGKTYSFDTNGKMKPVDSNKKNNNNNAKTGHKIYVTRTGKKYHYDSSCNGGTYYETTLDDALRRGLTPCSKCVHD